MNTRGPVFVVLIAVSLVGLGSVKDIPTSEPQALVKIMLPNQEMLERIESIGLPVYVRLTGVEGTYLLSGATLSRVHALRRQGLDVTALDLDMEGASYYLAYLMPNKPCPQWNVFGRVLLDDGRQTLLRISPQDAERLTETGVELCIVTFDPKPLRPVLAEGLMPASFGYDPVIQSMIDQVNSATIYDYTGSLSGEWPVNIDGQPYTIATRYTDSGEPINMATQFVGQHLEDLGLDVEYHQWGDPSCPNVVGELTGLTNPEAVFIICAHIDDRPSGPVAPGADDNASGVTGVLIAADILTQYDWDYTLRFALWTGEEQGKLGSHAYAQRSFERGENIVGVLNLDMIAWNTPSSSPDIELHADQSGVPSSMQLAQLFADVVGVYNLSLNPQIIPYGTGRSDHFSFWTYGYNAILGIECMADFNPYYHSTDDRLEYLDMNYYTDFVKASVATFAHMIGLVFDLTVSVDGTGVVTSDPIHGINCGLECSGQFEPGTTVVLTSNAGEDFVFSHWTGDVLPEEENSNPLEVFMDSHKSVGAVFKDRYTLELIVGEGGTTVPDPGFHSYPAGDTVILEATPDPGYRFDKWTDGEDLLSTNPHFEFTISSDMTVGAHFIRQHTLTVNTEPAVGGTTLDPYPPGPHEIDEGESVSVTARANQGYRFANWSDAASGTNETVSVTMDSPKTITANFKKTYILTVNVWEGGSVEIDPPNVDPYDENTYVTLTAVPDPVYRFNRWIGDIGAADPTESPLTIKMDDKKTVTAYFKRQYTLTVNAGEGGSVQVDPLNDEPYDENTYVTLTAVPDPGAAFHHWEGNIGIAHPNDPQIEIMMDTDKTITAHFVESWVTIEVIGEPVVGQEFTVKVQGYHPDGILRLGGPGYGQVYDCSQPVTEGSLSFYITPDQAGPMTLVAWLFSCIWLGSPAVQVEITIDVAPSRYTLTITSDYIWGGGTDPLPGAYVHDANTVVEITGNLEQGFSHWTGDVPGGIDKNPTIFITMDSDKTVHANFLPVKNWLIVSAGEGGTTEPPPNTHLVSTTAQSVEAIPAEGYLFSHWTGDVPVGEETVNPVTVFFEPGSNGVIKEITAHFVESWVRIEVIGEPVVGQEFSVDVQGYHPDGIQRLVLIVLEEQQVQVYDCSEPVTRGNIPPYGVTRDQAGPLALTAWLFSCNWTEGSLPTVVSEITIDVAPPGQYKLTAVASPEEWGSVEYSPVKDAYNPGDRVLLTASAFEGYQFDKWEENIGEQDPKSPEVVITMDANKTVTAIFVSPPSHYTLEVVASPEDGGSVEYSPVKDLYNPGDRVLLSATAFPGYHFGHWTGDIGAQDPSSVEVVITMDANKVVTAHFVAPSGQYKLEVMASPADGGSVEYSPVKNFYVPGDRVLLTASALPGYEFDGWTGNIGEQDPSSVEIVITMDAADKVVVAHFVSSSAQYTLNVEVRPEGSGWGSVEKSPDKEAYNPGDRISLAATANPGYWFDKWEGDIGEQDPASPEIVITMGAEDKTVIAKFVNSWVQIEVIGEPVVGEEFSVNAEGYHPDGIQRLEVAEYRDQLYDCSESDTERSLSFDITPGQAGPMTLEVLLFSCSAPESDSASDEITIDVAPPGQYRLNVDVSPERGGNVERSPVKDYYNPGDRVSLAATANPGYWFDKWEGNIGEQDPKSPEIVITMGAEDKTVIAHFVSNITVVQPNGGESLRQGDPYVITWDSVEGIGNVDIVLYKDGQELGIIDAGYPNTGSYEWIGGLLTIPPGYAAPAGGYTIRIQETSNPLAFDDSDAPFTIILGD